jgi:hypothetical protein
MTTQVTPQPDITGLIDEVRRYLIAVEVFREEGHQPRWWPEFASAPTLGAHDDVRRRTREIRHRA